MSSVASALAVVRRRVGEVDVVHTLSATNNTVLHVRVDGQDQVLKIMRDIDIPVSYLAHAGAHLGQAIPTARTDATFDRESDGFDGLLSEYVPGQSLFDLVRSGEYREHQERIAAGLREYIEATATLPLPGPGFGPFKVTAPPTATLADFVVGYARKYWSRARDQIEPELRALVDEWLGARLVELVSRAQTVRAFAVDSNLKNFILTPSGELVTLNVPIVARSVPGHAFGAVSFHLRHTGLREPVLAGVAGSLAVADFEIWALLGVLSFHAVSNPSRPDEWRNWGSPIGLVEDLQALMAEVVGGGR